MNIVLEISRKALNKCFIKVRMICDPEILSVNAAIYP